MYTKQPSIDIDVSTSKRVEGRRSFWAQNSILVEGRDTIVKAMTVQGIPRTEFHPRRLHMQPVYVGYSDGSGSFPVNAKVCERILYLPIPYLGDGAAECIAAVVQTAAEV